MTILRHGFSVMMIRVGVGFSVIFGLAIYAGPSPIDELAYAAQPAQGADAFSAMSISVGPQLVGPGLRALAAYSGQAVLVPNSATLINEYDRLGYTLAGTAQRDNAVPRVFLTQLPRDLPDIQSVPVRKSVFIRSLLPLVLRANEEVLFERAQIQALRARRSAGRSLTAAETAWLERLATEYKLDADDLGALLHRHDVVPVGLALAQGIEESGWGTSRFALQGNAVFGQWTFSKGAGIVPKGRDEGASHEVKAFPSLAGSVRQYVRNLNNHRAYREFRRERAILRAADRPMDSRILAKTMTRYSQRGAEYVTSILRLITTNKLDQLDGARLGANTRPALDS
jgi:Bax protein